MTGPDAGSTSPAVSLECPAKVNLHLRVVRRRPDGYHELDTIFQVLALSDQLIARRTDSRGVRLRITQSGRAAQGGLPVAAGADNLVHRAATAYLEAVGLAESTGLEFLLEKRIPAGGGLGGGSSDAAAALRLAQHLCSTHLPDEQLASLALDLGADLPFFLVGGTCRGRGVGEVLSPLPNPTPLELLLIFPGYGIDTGAVFRELSRVREAGGAQTELGLSYGIVDGMQLTETCRNDLEAPARRVEPRLDRLWHALEPAAGPHLRMSGSGSTLFVAHSDAARLSEMEAGVRAAVAALPAGERPQLLRTTSPVQRLEPVAVAWPEVTP